MSFSTLNFVRSGFQIWGIGLWVSALFSFKSNAVAAKNFHQSPSLPGESLNSAKLLARPLTSEAARSEMIEWLQKTLRSYPYWSWGHIHLARYLIASKKLKDAYYSITAAQQLPLSKLADFEARLLLGEVCLRTGDIPRAKETLRSLYEMSPLRAEVAEEYSACLLTERNFPEIQRILSQFAPSKLSPEGNAVLQVVERSLASNSDALKRTP